MTDQGPVRRWLVKTGTIVQIVPAVTQWGAWNTLRSRPVEDFGLIVTAEPDDSGDPIPVHTSQLMRDWGRFTDADLFDDAARAQGLID